MDVAGFPCGLEALQVGGRGLGAEERVVLTWSLRELHVKNKFEKTFFWGVVEAEAGNYFVAFGIRKDCVYGRTFYYSLNQIEWTLLPKPEERYLHLASVSTVMLKGDPAYKERIVDEYPGLATLVGSEEAVKDQQEEQPQGEEGGEGDGWVLKEEDRLATIVHWASDESALLPRGAVLKKLDGFLKINDGFEGLSAEEAALTTNYFHYRRPRNHWKTNLASRPDGDFAVDVLDPINDDIPTNQTWCVRKTNDGTIVLLNLIWLGMVAYHKPTTPLYGFFYYGNGIRNINLPFML